MKVSQIALSGTGPLCSRIALGFWRMAEWRLSGSELVKLINACLEIGVTTFDHADIYGNYSCESLFGVVLEQFPSLRRSMQLVTKCGIKDVSRDSSINAIKYYDTSKAHIITSLENSLFKLKTDYVDILLLHRPDPLMNADEVAEALTCLKESGKILNAGVSNFSTSQFELLQSRLDFHLVTNQVEFSVMQMEALYNGTLDQCQRLRLSPMAWSPLGGSRLFNDNSTQIVELRITLSKIANQLGASIDQVALAWILMHPARIVPILGTSKFARIESAARSEYLHLTREQWFNIWSASAQRVVL